MDWMILPLKRYVEFGGRSRRKEFWMFFLFTVLVGMAASIVDRALGYGTSYSVAAPGTYRSGWSDQGPVNSIASLLLLVPTFSVAFRRLHDTGRSAWWLLLLLVPILGWIALLVFYCGDGERGPNRFGADPKGVDLAGVFR